MSDYQGWSNYPTWVFHLWLTNEEDSCDMLEGMAMTEIRDALQLQSDSGVQKFIAIAALEASLLSYFDSYMDSQEIRSASLIGDLLTYASELIDFREVAKSIIADRWEEISRLDYSD